MVPIGRPTLLGVMILAIGFSAGCSRRGADPVRGNLSGKVRIKGNPVTGGNLIFHKEGKEAANLKINANGTYEGFIPFGDLQVGVETEALKKQLEDMANQGGRGGGQMPALSFSPKDMEKYKDKKMTAEDMMKAAMDPANLGKYVRIPEKYRDPQQSGLSVTMKDAKQEQDFDIP